jgi:hypothetical protein
MKDDVPMLIDRLKNHPEEEIRQDAAQQLGEIGDKRAIGPLIDAVLHDRIQWVRREAGYALGEIGDWKAAQALLDALDKDREWDLLVVVYENALEKIGEVYHYYTREEFVRELIARRVKAEARRMIEESKESISLDPSIEVYVPQEDKEAAMPEGSPQTEDSSRKPSTPTRPSTTTTVSPGPGPGAGAGAGHGAGTSAMGINNAVLKASIRNELARLMSVMATGEQVTLAQISQRFECNERFAEDVIIELLHSGQITGSYNAFTKIFTIR